ncbi:MAG: hypothetical protein AAB407_04010 [Patescibacteria group bacterium]
MTKRKKVIANRQNSPKKKRDRSRRTRKEIEAFWKGVVDKLCEGIDESTRLTAKDYNITINYRE